MIPNNMSAETSKMEDNSSSVFVFILCCIAVVIGIGYAVWEEKNDEQCLAEGMALESPEFKSCYLSRDADDTSICECLERARLWKP